MNETALTARILPALLTGTQRAPLPLEEVFGAALGPDDRAALKALALTGQRLRFQRPESAALSAEGDAVPSDRPFLDASLRKTFLSLVTGNQNENAALIAAAVASSMDRRRVAPHPFDLETAADFVRNHAALLGNLAFSFAQRRVGDADRESYFDWSALDEGTWAKAALGQRERFLRRKRMVDPAAALALLEADWPNLNAEGRFRLLACLRTGLGPQDLAFLSTLTGDRAPRVRDAAASMRARIDRSQTPAGLTILLERVKEGSSGMMRKRRVLSLEYPATVADHARTAWILDTFGQLGADRIALAFQCTAEEAIEASAKDEGLLLVLLLAATVDKRIDLVQAAAGGRLDAWAALCGTEFEGLAEYADGERAEWLLAAAAPRAWGEDADPRWIRKLLTLLGGEPIAPKVYTELLRSAWAKARLSGSTYADYRAVELLALLCPPADRTDLRERIRSDDDERRTARQLLEFLIALEEEPHG